MTFPVAKRVRSQCLAALLAAGLGSAVHAQVTVDGAWARATVPNQSATGAFMRMDLKKQIKAGERVPLTLLLTAADGSVLQVEVNATAASAPPVR